MRFHVVPTVAGRLAIATRPRGGDWLEMDLIRCKREGWSVLVSALEREEQDELGLDAEERTAIAQGLEFRSVPISDRSVPMDGSFNTSISALLQLLNNGANIAVHCRMGIGRSSLICAALLVAQGEDPEGAWSLVKEARGTDVPDTDEQRLWLIRDADALRKC